MNPDRQPAAREGETHTPCTSCGAPSALPDDILCPPYYAASRSLGRLLGFDPDHRKRLEKRLADRRYPDCQTVDCTVNPSGDAWCSTCASRRHEGGTR